MILEETKCREKILLKNKNRYISGTENKFKIFCFNIHNKESKEQPSKRKLWIFLNKIKNFANKYLYENEKFLKKLKKFSKNPNLKII